MNNSDSNNSKARSLFEEAKKVIPGGVSRNTIFRKPFPHYVDYAKGAYVMDIDGKERIDFANNMAALIHGHAFPPIVEAVTEQIKKGSAITMATETEVKFAQHLVRRFPGCEKIRFVNSGSEAVMAMIKACRAFTGREKIAKAEGAYHGTYDFAEISQTASPENWGDINKPNSVPVASGTPQAVLNDVIIFPFNDIERTLNILDQHADEIACVIIDPLPHRIGLMPATTEYVQVLYDWTRKNDALFCFDEVITFRVNFRGAQQNYPIIPDMTTLGKIIGGGFPVGAFAGRSEIMEVLDPFAEKVLLPHSGTFSANPVTMTAGRIAMEFYDQKAVIDINELTKSAVKQLNEVIKLADVPVCITGAGSMFRFHLQPTPPTNYREAYQPPFVKKLIKEMLDYLYDNKGIMMINTMTCVFSTVMAQKEVDILSDGVFEAFRKFKPQIEAVPNLKKPTFSGTK